MAQKIAVQLYCDQHDEGDEVEAVQTVSFGYEGSTYAFELCQQHLDEFHGAMQRFVGIARRAGSDGGATRARRASSGGGGARRSTADKGELQAIREWARGNGFQVSDRGRISGEVRDAYEAAQGKKKK